MKPLEIHFSPRKEKMRPTLTGDERDRSPRRRHRSRGGPEKGTGHFRKKEKGTETHLYFGEKKKVRHGKIT